MHFNILAHFTLGATMMMSKVALTAGSSQQGKACLASVASNWVTAANLSSPSTVYLVLVTVDSWKYLVVMKFSPVESPHLVIEDPGEVHVDGG